MAPPPAAIAPPATAPWWAGMRQIAHHLPPGLPSGAANVWPPPPVAGYDAQPPGYAHAQYPYAQHAAHPMQMQPMQPPAAYTFNPAFYQPPHALALDPRGRPTHAAPRPPMMMMMPPPPPPPIMMMPPPPPPPADAFIAPGPDAAAARPLSRSAPHQPPWDARAMEREQTPGPGQYNPRDVQAMVRMSFNARFSPNEDQPGYGRYEARPLAARPRLGFVAKPRPLPPGAATIVAL